MNAVFGKAPTLGVVSNSIGVFDEGSKKTIETQMRTLVEQLIQRGEISPQSVFYPKRTCGPQDMAPVVDAFARAKVDAVIVLDSAFPNGNAFLTLATDPYLRHVPLIAVCPPEFKLASREWSVNSYCGVIMNNFVARRLGRPLFTLCGLPESGEFQTSFARLLSAARAIRALREDLIGRFGDAPSGFHSANGDQMAYARVFGTRIEVMDLAGVLTVYEQAKTTGPLGERSFSEQDIEATYAKMMAAGPCECELDRVRRAARLYHAYKAIIEANGYTAVAIRCWPDFFVGHMHIAQCLVLGWLMSENVVRVAACESDWTTAVAASMGAVLAGQPSPCVDFIGDLSASSLVTLGHCGVGIPRLMSRQLLSHIGPDRQAGCLYGPTCEGQYAYGPKTGVSIIQDDGVFKMLAFTGANSAETDQKRRISGADIICANHRRLNELVFEHGFPHHLALVFGDVTAELKLLAEFYGMEYYNPDAIG